MIVYKEPYRIKSKKLASSSADHDDLKNSIIQTASVDCLIS